MTEVLAETQPTGVLAPCTGCGHPHHAHRGASPASGRSVCLAAIPVKRNGEPPGFGEYTGGQGSVGTGSVCSCNRCLCRNCAPAAVAA